MPYARYTAQEKLEMVRRYYGGASYRDVRKHFAAEHPDRPIPSVTTIQTTVRRLETTFCLVVGHEKKIKLPSGVKEGVRLAPCDNTMKGPKFSFVQTAKNANVSKASIGKTLRDNSFRPEKIIPPDHQYHRTTDQNLQPKLEPLDDDNKNSVDGVECRAMAM